MFSSRVKVWLPFAIAVIAAMVLAGGLSWQFTKSDDTQTPGSGLNFYMEYTIERTGVSAVTPGMIPFASSGRWWYEAPNKSRYEFDYDDQMLGKSVSVRATDGRTAASYEGTTNTYRRSSTSPPERHPLGSGPLSPTWASMPVGPLGFATVDEALQRLARGGGTVTRAGEETVIGRKADVYVIERSFAPLPDGLPGRERETYWIEAEPLAILKGVAESTDGIRLTVAATKLEYRPSIDDSTFRLKQPAGSQDVSATPPATTSAMGESTVPAPFLTATYLPEGFRWAGSSGSPEISHTQEFRSADGGYLRIDQRYRHGGWPSNVPVPGTEMPYSAGSIWLVQDAASVVLLSMRGDIIVRVEAEGVSYSQAASVLAGVLFVLR